MSQPRIEVVDRGERFAALRDEWRELLADSAANNLFLTWEWLHTWWRFFGAGRRLAIVTVRQDGRLLAIAPLARSSGGFASLYIIPRLELLGSGDVGSDYLDIIVRRGAEQTVAHTLGEELGARRQLLRLPQLSGTYSMGATIAQRLQGMGWSPRVARTDVCPFIPLAGTTFDGYLATLGSSHRQNFRRRVRQLERDFEMRFTRIETEADRREALPVLVGLHNGRWMPRGGSTAFYAPALVNFHDELSRTALDAGWLRLHLLALDGQPAAALYGFAYNGKFYFYQAGFDQSFARYSVGLVTMGLSIAAAIGEGLGEYDLLHGDEKYKSLWSRQSHALTGLELYPPNLLGTLSRATGSVYRAARSLARRVTPQSPSRTNVEPDLVVPSSR